MNEVNGLALYLRIHGWFALLCIPICYGIYLYTSDDNDSLYKEDDALGYIFLWIFVSICGPILSTCMLIYRLFGSRIGTGITYMLRFPINLNSKLKKMVSTYKYNIERKFYVNRLIRVKSTLLSNEITVDYILGYSRENGYKYIHIINNQGIVTKVSMKWMDCDIIKF